MINPKYISHCDIFFSDTLQYVVHAILSNESVCYYHALLHELILRYWQYIELEFN